MATADKYVSKITDEQVKRGKAMNRLHSCDEKIVSATIIAYGLLGLAETLEKISNDWLKEKSE